MREPKAKVPGTKMAFAGIKDPQKLNDLIAYQVEGIGEP